MNRPVPRPLNLALLLGSSLWLAACSSVFPTGTIDYKSSSEVKSSPLEVPPDLSQLSRDTRYVVPGTIASASSMPSIQAGLRRSVASDAVADVKFERMGAQRWLRVERPADEVWDRVRSFWINTGFALTTDNAELGLLETEWAENRAKLPQDFLRRTLGKVIDGLYSTGERDKFRIRVERVSNSSTEIYVTHRGMEEVYSNNDRTATGWQPRASDPSLEVEMLRRLMVHLGTKEETANASVAAAGTGSGIANLPAGTSSILFDERFDLAWRRTSVALDRAGFTVEDRDRKAGVFFVRYVDRPPEGQKEPGFFSRLFSTSPTQTPVRMRISVQEESGNRSRISVLNESGQADQTAVAQKIARLIFDELK